MLQEQLSRKPEFSFYHVSALWKPHGIRNRWIPHDLPLGSLDKVVRTAPIGSARYARDYFDSAIAADDVLGTREGYEIHAPVPVMILVAHSIELILKACLFHVGVSPDEMKRQVVTCWEAAIENGINQHFNPTDEELDI